MARRASGSDQARNYRQAGHDIEFQFASSIGGEVYKNDQFGKTDVVDPSGNTHSVKAGEKKWQIFLYRRSRFAEDPDFQVLNGIGLLLIQCIDAFPESYELYVRDKHTAKEHLRLPMRTLKRRLQDKDLLRDFLQKSIFNGTEVEYLTIHHHERFHVFHRRDVIHEMGEVFSVENSRARHSAQYSDQKVLFKYKKRNVGELEMRNDSRQHYREIRFNMLKGRAVDLLRSEIITFGDFSDDVRVYGEAIRTFGNWNR